ncbi:MULTISPECIES: hypothetical protein [unclassified Leifsonia]|uniref:hypothetical protein n=1 Tax=unclassified Leifsonia TaxID=2663824 RepID=UPI0008A7E0AC|nr:MULTISPECIES: hypothetical protein [unclassified Leifsonia]SEH66971.1 hypothetical protein SAMN04515694_10294 [Leifsonia sp. CL154]SFL28666.1 hypothetical protein SAMN04515692_10295 [Leifsonia sp. CL147]
MAATDPGAEPPAGAPRPGPNADARLREHLQAEPERDERDERGKREWDEDELQEGGDAACWLAQVCVECGALREGPGVCRRCGAS